MQTRPFGRLGRTVHEVGFGTWGMPGTWWRGIDPAEARRALRYAIEQGVDFVDTALVYGDGIAETWVGEAVRDTHARDRVMIASKVPPANGEWPGRGNASLRSVFAPEYVMKSVETTLRNVRTEAISLMQLHVWHDAWLDDPTWPALRGTMELAVRQGKVLHWGISANDKGASDAVRAVAEPIIDSVQVIYNIFEREPERALFAAAAKHQVAVIVRCPLDEGALGGDVGAETVFHPSDWRTRYFRGDRLAQLSAKLAALSALVEIPPRAAKMGHQPAAPDRPECVTVAELALRFCLSRPEVTTVIPGMRSVAHVMENLLVSDGRVLSPRTRERLLPFAWDKNWYVDEREPA